METRLVGGHDVDDCRASRVSTFSSVIEEGFNTGHTEVLDPLFQPGFTEHQRGFPTSDLSGLKRGIEVLRRGIPDIHLEVVDTIAEGDKICFVLEGTGTHLGPLGPLPASGAKLRFSVIDICRFEGVQIVEHWGIPDQMGILEEIGMPHAPRWLMALMMRRPRARRHRGRG